jgi:hypothetical protein
MAGDPRRCDRCGELFERAELIVWYPTPGRASRVCERCEQKQQLTETKKPNLRMRRMNRLNPRDVAILGGDPSL